MSSRLDMINSTKDAGSYISRQSWVGSFMQSLIFCSVFCILTSSVVLNEGTEVTAVLGVDSVRAQMVVGANTPHRLT